MPRITFEQGISLFFVDTGGDGYTGTNKGIGSVKIADAER